MSAFAEFVTMGGDGATGGLILMDAAGRSAWAFTTPRMARAGWCAGQDPWTLVE